MNSPAPTAVSSPKREARKGQLFLLGSIAVLIVAASLVNAVATRRWKDFTDRNEAAVAKLETSAGMRTPLAGTSTPGNAWDEYMVAAAALEKAVDASELTGSEFGEAISGRVDKRDQRAATDRLRGFLPKAGAALDKVRDATHRGRAIFPTEWDKGNNDSIPLNLVSTQHLSRLLVFKARERLAAGDRSGALDDLIVALQLDVDLARVPYLLCAMVGFSEIKSVTEELKGLSVDPATPLADLERIRDATEAAEHLLPSAGGTFAHDGLLARRKLQEAGDGKGNVYDLFKVPRHQTSNLLYFAQTWRYWFSNRLALLDANRSFEAATECFQVGESEDLVTASARYEALEPNSKNPVISIVVPEPGLIHELQAFDFHWRAVKGRLRLVRAACMIRQGLGPSDVDWPVDPVDLKPLRHRETNGIIRIWSLRYALSSDDTRGLTWQKVDEDHFLELKNSSVKAQSSHGTSVS